MKNSPKGSDLVSLLATGILVSTGSLLITASHAYWCLTTRGEMWNDSATSVLSAFLVAGHIFAGWFWPRSGILAGSMIFVLCIIGMFLGFSLWVTPLELSPQSLIRLGLSSPVALACATAITSSAALRLRYT